MALFQVMAPRQGANPRRTLSWTGIAQAGDDLKFAFTLLQDDGETVADVTQANARMTLLRDEWDHPRWDYGLVWLGNHPATIVDGWVFDGPNGRVNFFVPSAQSAALYDGQYRLFFEIDQPDGVTTEIVGQLAIRGARQATLGNAARTYMRVAATPLGGGLLPPMVLNNLASDANGFPLAATLPTAVADSNAVPGRMILGRAVLGDPGVAPASVAAPTVNTSVGIS